MPAMGKPAIWTTKSEPILEVKNVKKSLTFSESMPKMSGYEEFYKMNHGHYRLQEFEERQSPWASLWLCNLIQLLCGVQFSIYFTSMWPFLSALDSSATLEFFGLVMAAYSFSQALSAPLWGFWSQKSQSTRWPVCAGMTVMAAGNMIYAALPAFDNNAKWAMLFARLLTGLGSGILGCLGAYTATASVPRDRSRAISLGIGSLVIGIAIGPSLQAVFLPFGSAMQRGRMFVFNMYTVPSYAVIGLSALTIILLTVFFKEQYSGVLSQAERKASIGVLPKFDKLAAGICIYAWVCLQSVGTGLEVLQAPLTIAMYNWTADEAILYNGIIQTIAAIVSSSIYAILAFTPIGKMCVSPSKSKFYFSDGRKLALFGLTLFMIYHIANIPWPFYDGPLDYMKLAENGTIESTAISGGCFLRYTWCSHTNRVPLVIFVISTTMICGSAFSFIASPVGTIYSRILGPRQQGTMQGLYAFFGGLTRCLMPLLTTFLFEKTGFLWLMLGELVILAIGVILLCVYYHRLIPLNLVPPAGQPVKYKDGTFYRF